MSQKDDLFNIDFNFLFYPDGDVGERFTLNSTSDNAMALSTTVNSSIFSNSVKEMTLCFWIRITQQQQLGTILSYGVGGESLTQSCSKCSTSEPTPHSEIQLCIKM